VGEAPGREDGGEHRHGEAGDAGAKHTRGGEDDRELWAERFDDGSTAEEQRGCGNGAEQSEGQGLAERERGETGRGGADGLDDPVLAARS
jgi:hypothetical protein